MKKPAHTIDIFLQPGEWYFGGRDTSIRTVLGSCVSITLWHPRRLLGGMCHYMLPSRGGKAPPSEWDGRYADEAIELMLREMRAAGTRPSEYELKLFGGGNMFPRLLRTRKNEDVPFKNVETARALARHYGFRILAEHLGGEGHRNVRFDIWSGHVWLKHDQCSSNDLCELCEQGIVCQGK